MMIREATTADAPGMARVHVDTWHTTYRGLVPDAYLESLTYGDKQRMWERALNNPDRQSSIYVAESDDGEIAGFVAGGPTRTAGIDYVGELYSIYILKVYQGAGLGRRFVETLVEGMLKVGIRSMTLWVLAGNPAERFYIAIGGQEIHRQPFELSGALLEEVCYAWRDISSILTGKQPAK